MSFGKLSVGEMPVRGTVLRGNIRWRTVRQGNVGKMSVGEMSVGDLSRYHIGIVETKIRKRSYWQESTLSNYKTCIYCIQDIDYLFKLNSSSVYTYTFLQAILWLRPSCWKWKRVNEEVLLLAEMSPSNLCDMN